MPAHLRTWETRLTPRERYVLSLMGNGLTRDEAAYSMGVSPRTIKTMLEVIRAKLNARNTTHAVYLHFATGQQSLFREEVNNA